MFLDTSALIDLMRSAPDDERSRRIRSALQDERIYLSPIQMGELADYARRFPLPLADLLQRVRSNSEFVTLTPEVAIQGAAIKAEVRALQKGTNFSLIDGILLASARAIGQGFLTSDRAFPTASDIIVV